MVDETQDKKIYSRNLSVGLIQGMDRLSPMMIKTIDAILWLIAIFIGSILLYLVAQILFFMLDISKNQRINDFEQFNKVLITAGSLIGALITLGFLIWRTMIAQKQNTIAQENIHSITMAKAIEQLGAMKEEKYDTASITKPNIEVRLGAIYLLEKLAREHEQLHWPIMEILSAYIRENTGKPIFPDEEIISLYAKGESRTIKEDKTVENRKRKIINVRPDVQAAINVIGRRSYLQIGLENKILTDPDSRGSYRIDLSNCHLSGFNFANLNFNRAIFSYSCLEAADFTGSDLKNAYFLNTTLCGVTADGADFDGALFIRVECQGGDFSNCEFNNFHFSSINLSGAIMSGTRIIGSSFYETSFSNAYFGNTKFIATRLGNRNFSLSNFYETQFLGCDLSGSQFNGASIEGVVFEDSKIDGANFTDCDEAHESQFDSSWYDAKTIFPNYLQILRNKNYVDDGVKDFERTKRWDFRRQYWLIENTKK